MSDARRSLLDGLTLRCCACGRSVEYEAFTHRCPECAEALELQWGAAAPAATADAEGGMWRHAPALPPVDMTLVRQRVTMGEGGTPLLRAARLEAELGCREIWLKDETRNPTGSFKDRGTALGVAVLAQLGFGAVGTVSTGNMARSVAAYAARAGMDAVVWVGTDTPPHKLAPVAVHGAHMWCFDAPYGHIYRRSLEWSSAAGVPFVNSDSALRVAGQKTIALEIGEQLAGRAPDWMFVPTSSGGNLSAIAGGFAEAAQAGVLRGKCRLVAVQAAGCAPIAGAWAAGAEHPVHVAAPRTIAGAISNPSPPSGSRALRWLRHTDGRAVAVTDAEIEAAQLRLAALTGRFVQPASAAGMAALCQLLAAGVVAPDDTAVLLLTGSGSNAPAPVIDLPVRSLDRLPSKLR